MRLIKFRIWDKDRSVMAYPSCIDFENNIINYYDRIENKDEHYQSYHSTKNFDIMQTTNRLDINGKEIFEGDIVNYIIGGIECIGSILWIGDSFQHFKGVSKTPIYMLRDFEIIGNIYEHPDLVRVLHQGYREKDHAKPTVNNRLNRNLLLEI